MAANDWAGGIVFRFRRGRLVVSARNRLIQIVFRPILIIALVVRRHSLTFRQLCITVSFCCNSPASDRHMME
jgi:hypothetical protein